MIDDKPAKMIPQTEREVMIKEKEPELVKHVLWWERIISFLVTNVCKAICRPESASVKHKWPTFDQFENDFYERRVSPFNKSKRITEPLVYSNGKWLTSITMANPSSFQTKQQCVQFRGINLPAKTPLVTSFRDSFSTLIRGKKAISFIDRPFPLIDAPSHFERLSNYGFNIVRLTVTWEAVMHAGPGIIDHDYLQYLSDLVDVACAYGIYVVMDPHQDVWSRMTGGDGAPEWTLDRVGFDMAGGGDLLHRVGVAWLHPLHRDASYKRNGIWNYANDSFRDSFRDQEGLITLSEDEEEGVNDSDVVHMGWTTNMGRLATATMFTLFFAGDTFAPGITIEDDGVDETGASLNICNTEGDVEMSCSTPSNNPISLQTYLQKYYLQFLSAVAQAVKDKPNVLGFNTMNEPSNGMAGAPDLTSQTFPTPIANPLSFFDGMRLSSGEALRAEQYNRPFLYQKIITLNPDRLMAWKSVEHDIWRRMGVYEVDDVTEERRLLEPAYFKLEEGKNFLDEYMVPFYEKVRGVVCAQNERFVIFAEPHIEVMNLVEEKAPEALDAAKFAWAPHWYDGLTLILKQYISWVAVVPPSLFPIFSAFRIQRALARTLKHLKNSGKSNMYVFLGETGAPMNIDFNNGEGDCENIGSTMSLDRTMRAVEQNNLGAAMWCYDTNNTWLEGDRWNGEDFSIRTSSGTVNNRALLSAVRPFAVMVGQDLEVVSQCFDPSTHSKRFELVVRRSANELDDCNSMDGGKDVVIFLPLIHFKHTPDVSPSSGTFEINADAQELTWKGVTFKSRKKSEVCKLVIINIK